jgi:hypothetical protein
MIMTARDLPDFFAGSLRKVFVPLANSKELFRHNHRRDVIGGTTDFVIGRAYKQGRITGDQRGSRFADFAQSAIFDRSWTGLQPNQ